MRLLTRPPTAGKTAPAASEQAVHRAVVQHLRVRAAPGVFAFHPANGGFRRRTEAAIFKSMGVVAGTPDLIIVHAGRTFALELKSREGKLTAAQRLCLDLMEKAGATVGVAFGLDEALAFLEQHGLLKGRAS